MWYIVHTGTRIDGFESYKAAVTWAKQNLKGHYTVAEQVTLA